MCMTPTPEKPESGPLFERPSHPGLQAIALQGLREVALKLKGQ